MGVHDYVSTVYKALLFCSESEAVINLLFWHAPLGVCSVIRKPSQRTVLSQIDCFIQCEVISSQISRRCSTMWCEIALVVSSVRIILASASSSIRAQTKKDAVTGLSLWFGCLVILLTSSLWTNWCHLSPSSVVLEHHWSRASVLHASTLVTAQHSDPYIVVQLHLSWDRHACLPEVVV